jgi:hypothetical protein
MRVPALLVALLFAANVQAQNSSNPGPIWWTSTSSLNNPEPGIILVTPLEQAFEACGRHRPRFV